MKQLRAVLFHNGADSSVDYARQLSEQIRDEVHVVNVYDPHPVRDVLPIRAVPNVAVLLFADTMEEGQELVSILSQLNFCKKQDEIAGIVDELIELAGDKLTPGLSERIVQAFYEEE